MKEDGFDLGNVSRSCNNVEHSFEEILMDDSTNIFAAIEVNEKPIKLVVTRFSVCVWLNVISVISVQ
jgi:hypothetical protein